MILTKEYLCQALTCYGDNGQLLLFIFFSRGFFLMNGRFFKDENDVKGKLNYLEIIDTMTF